MSVTTGTVQMVIGKVRRTIVSDAVPKEIAGLGNVSSIATPIAMGYIIRTTGS
jgi:hypothetical protein